MAENTPVAQAKTLRPKRDSSAAARGEVVTYPTKSSTYAVRPARRRLRHYAAVASFLAAVLVPTAMVVGYLHTRAADQYASTVAFSVRGHEAQMVNSLLGALVQNAGTGATDAQIVYEFVRSQQMIEAAAQALPLAEIYNRPSRDFVFRLGDERSIEDLVAYWNWMTDIAFDPGAGIVRFEARAFRPDDAQSIAAFVLAESTRIVNDLSEQAQDDAIRVAQGAVTEAEERLRAARRAMRDFRDAQQEVNPAANADAALSLVAVLEEELARSRVALDTEMQLVGPQSPRLQSLRQQIASLEKQIINERERFGTGAGADELAPGRLAQLLSDFEERQVDLEFAENAYVSALAAYEQSQIEARRQSRFLAPHIEPTLSMEPQYPQRLLISLGTFALLLIVWSVTLLILYNIKERR